jgi:hypothetical protein
MNEYIQGCSQWEKVTDLYQIMSYFLVLRFYLHSRHFLVKAETDYTGVALETKISESNLIR